MPELGAAFRPGTLASITRARGAAVLVLPVVAGSTLAWDRAGVLAWGPFLLVLAAFAFGVMAVNVLGDVADDASGAAAAARADGLSAPTGSDAISSGAVTRTRAIAIAATLAGLGLACVVALGVVRSWVPFVLALAAFTVAAATTAARSRLAFLAEALTVVSAGVLPTAAGYAAQTRHANAVAFAAGVVPGILLMLVLYHQSFLRHRSDAQIGAPSSVSRLGPRRAAVASAAFAAVAVAVLLWQVAARVWPVWALLSLAGFAPLLAAYPRIAEEPESIHVQLPFLGAAVGSATVTNVVLIVSLVIDAARR